MKIVSAGKARILELREKKKEKIRNDLEAYGSEI